MKTTRIFRSLMVMIFVAIASPNFANDITVNNNVVETPEARLEALHNRLEEIKAMDRSKMSKTERKALRSEVKAIKEEAKAISGGVYISIGAILVLILLLILLL